jgi:hypothetical protein
MERIMIDRQFEPGKPGWSDCAPQHRGGTPTTEERRQAGPPATLDQNIEQAFDGTEDIDKNLQQQAYPIRLLKRRYGLSHNYAAFVAAEFRWEGA